MAGSDEVAREMWARRTACRLVDGILAVAERSPGSHSTVDQVTLLREIARRALWHMPQSSDEAQELLRDIEGEEETPWA